MTDSDMERKRELLKALAKELGVRLKDAPSGERGKKFRAERFMILAEIAAKFENVMQGSTLVQYNREAEKFVEDYWNNHLDRTEKSNKGGVRKGYTDLVKCGSGAGRIFDGLQARIDHWQAFHDHIPASETLSERARRRELANRFLKQRDAKKHLGRPSKVIGEIEIHALPGGSPLESIAFALARYLLEYGDKALSDDVLDAMLDNGGPKNGRPETSKTFADLVAQCEALISSGSLPNEELSRLKQALEILQRRF